MVTEALAFSYIRHFFFFPSSIFHKNTVQLGVLPDSIKRANKNVTACRVVRTTVNV